VVDVGAAMVVATLVVPFPATVPTDVPPHEPLKNSNVPKRFVAVGNEAVRVMFATEFTQKLLLLDANPEGASLYRF